MGFVRRGVAMPNVGSYSFHPPVFPEKKDFAMNVTSMAKLSVGDTGSFRELSAKRNPDGLALVYVPGLGALLERARQLKGSELSEEESARIAQAATVMAATPQVAKQTIQNRGYE
jgi:hypothetical protein